MVRFKNRYLVIEMIWERSRQERNFRLTREQLLSTIKESISLNFGDFGLAAVNPTLQGLRRNEFWIQLLLFSDFFFV